MQLYPSHRPFQSHPIYRHSTTMQWCCGYYWLPQGLELHHYRSYVRTHFAVLQFKILLRMITNMIHMISHTPSSYNIIKIVRNRLEQGPLTCPEHWTVVSQNLEHLTLFFSKPGTPDSADLFLHESYFLKLRQCTLTLKLAGQNLPNEAVDFKHFYLHLHCTTVSLQSGETLLETDNFENWRQHGKITKRVMTSFWTIVSFDLYIWAHFLWEVLKIRVMYCNALSYREGALSACNWSERGR